MNYPLIANVSMEPGGFFLLLVGLGILVGILTGIFGVGGAFLTVPVMISALGVDPTVAIGSTIALSMITGAYGFWGHAKLKNIELTTTMVVGGVSALATFGGKGLHDWLKHSSGIDFDWTMKVILLGLLLPLAGLVWFTANRDVRPLLDRGWLQIPPLIDLPRAGLSRISLTLLVACGLVIGLLKGLTAIGAGVIMVPILIWVVGLRPHMAVGTSLGAIMISSVAGVVAYARTGDIAWNYVLALLLGGLVGTALGLRIAKQLPSKSLKRYFALILLGVSALVAWEMVT